MLWGFTPKKIHVFNHPECGEIEAMENEDGDLLFSVEDVARMLNMTLEEVGEALIEMQKRALQ